MPKKKIYIIAGEASGDNLGSKLMAALKNAGKVEFFGLGGDKMAKEGLNSVFPMSEISLMGFLEIIPHIPNLLDRINQTVEDIEKHKPDMVITIDSPGFCCRVASKLQGKNIPLVHYVAPTVWAYKPKRAEKFARLFDHLLVILPFEPPYFEKVGLKTTYIGHPIIEEPFAKGNGAAFRKRHNIDADAKVLCAMPGSRNGELARLLPIYQEAIEIISDKTERLHVVIPTISSVAQKVQKFAESLPVPATVIEAAEEKYDAYAASDVALAKSGTGTLELSLAKIPMIIVYKVNFLTHFILKRLVKIKYANLVNLISDKEVIPEFLQNDCTAENLAENLAELLNNKKSRDAQVKNSKNAIDQLGKAPPTPSERAAAVILKIL